MHTRAANKTRTQLGFHLSGSYAHTAFHLGADIALPRTLL
jgi:hypothetical protein